MALCFVAVVNVPGNPVDYRVLRSMSLRGAKMEAKKRYMVDGGIVSIWDGHPSQFGTKEVATIQ